MKTKKNLGYGTQNLFCVITVILTLALTALSLTGCGDVDVGINAGDITGIGGNTGGGQTGGNNGTGGNTDGGQTGGTDNTTTLTGITAVYTPDPENPIFTDTDKHTLKDDLTVTASYSDSTTKPLTMEDYELSGELTEGQSTITVTYTEGDITETDTFTVTVYATHDHIWSGWAVISGHEATCTEAGEERRDCTAIPAHHETREAAPLGHDWNDTYTTVTPATETTDGVEAVTCKHNSAHTQPRTQYATGTAGLEFQAIGSPATAYRVRKGTAVTTGAIHIPAMRRPNATSPYLPVTEIGAAADSNTAGAFTGTAITAVHIPDSVTTIGGYAFLNCTSLASVIIPDSVTTIGLLAFQGCTGLTSVTIGAGVTSIGNQAFYGCTGLTGSLTIPAGAIGSGVFQNTGLTSVTIGAGVTSIGSDAFNINSLTSITVDADNPNFSSQDNIVYNKAKTSIELVPVGISGHVTIPAGVTSIGNNAFNNCAGLTSVTIPAGVTSIGTLAFNATGLTSVTIPAGVTSIGNQAFSSISTLASVTFQGTIPSTGFGTSNVFWASNLRTVFYATDATNGTPGTYTTAAPGQYATWTLQP